MGAIGKAGDVACRAAVHAERAISRIEIVRDGAVAWAEECGCPDATVNWRDQEAGTGEHYYYLHVIQADGQMAWSSPVWVRTPDTSR